MKNQLLFVVCDALEGVAGVIAVFFGMFLIVLAVSFLSKIFNVSVRSRSGTTINPDSFDNFVGDIKEKSKKTIEISKSAASHLSENIKNVLRKGNVDKIQAIKDLSELKANGAINETEFERLKKEILSK